MSAPAQRGRSPMICRYEMPQGLLLSGRASVTSPVSSPAPRPGTTWLQYQQPPLSPLSGRQPNASPPPRAQRLSTSSCSTPIAPPPPRAASGYSASRLITGQVSEVAIASQQGSHVAAPLLGHGGRSSPSLSPSPPRAVAWGMHQPVGSPPSPSPMLARAPSGSPPVARRAWAAMPGTMQQHGAYSLSASSSSPALPMFSGGSSARATVAVPAPAPSPTSYTSQMPGSARVSVLPMSGRNNGVQKSMFEQSPGLGGSSGSRAVSPLASLSPCPSPLRPAPITAAGPKLVHPPKAASTAATSKPSRLSYDSLLRGDDRRPSRSGSPMADKISLSWKGQAMQATLPAGAFPASEASFGMPMAYLPTSDPRPPPSMRMSDQSRSGGSLSTIASRRKAKAVARQEIIGKGVLSKPKATGNPMGVQTVPRRASAASSDKGVTGSLRASASATAITPISQADGPKSRTVAPMVGSAKTTTGTKPASVGSVLSASRERLETEKAPLPVSQTTLPPPVQRQPAVPLDGSVKVSAQAAGDAASQDALQAAQRAGDGSRGRSSSSQRVLVADPRPRSTGDGAPRRSSPLQSPELQARRAGAYSTPDMRHRRTGSTMEVEVKSELDEACVVRNASTNASKEPGLGDAASGRFEPVPETKVAKAWSETFTSVTSQKQTASAELVSRPLSAEPPPVVTAFTTTQPIVTIASPAPTLEVAPVKYVGVMSEVTAQNGGSKLAAPALVEPAVIAEVSTSASRSLPTPSGYSLEVHSPPVLTPPTGDRGNALLHDVKLDLGNKLMVPTAQQPETDVTLVSQRTELLLEEGAGPNSDSPEKQCALITEDILSRQSVGKMDDSQESLVPSEIFRNLSQELALHMEKQSAVPKRIHSRSVRISRVLYGP